jgi:hypothetical protein
VPVTPGHGPQPNALANPLPTAFSGGDRADADAPALSAPELENRLKAVFHANGFALTGSHRFDTATQAKGRLYPAGGLAVWAERNVRVDVTRENRIRLRMYASLVGGGIFFALAIYASSLPSVPKWTVIVLAVLAATPLAVALISLGQDSFWSELVMVYFAPLGTPPPSPVVPPLLSQVASSYSQAFESFAAGSLSARPPTPSTGETPSAGWRMECRAAVVRTTNWATKPGSGRHVAEAHREPALAAVLDTVTESVIPSSDPLPSEFNGGSESRASRAG